jgi:N-methylhydantoinase A
VTDANLLLGYLDESSELAGEVRLDRDAAARALGELADRLALDELDCADGIVRVASAEMARALRVMTVERGVDPRRYALVAFGGAGPMHAARLADELEIERVVCPRGAGVLSAVGLVVTGARRDLVQSVLLDDDQIRAGEAGEAISALAARARAELPGASVEASYDLRYRGQSFELTIPAPLDARPELLRERFEAAHRERYGFADPGGALELVNVRITALADAPAVEFGEAASGGEPERGARRARFADGVHEAEVLRGEPPPGEGIEGPAIVELAETTVVVPPGWRAQADEHGSIGMERGA